MWGEEAPADWVLYVIDYMPSPSLCGLLCALIIMYHPPTPPTVQRSLSPSLLFLSTLNQHPLAPISSICPVHYVHSTCGAHFISLRLREERGFLSLLSVMNVSVNSACTQIPAGYSQHHQDTEFTLGFNLSLSPFCWLNWGKDKTCI